jgi:solute carrier family 25 phosphate transporter 23/24/25/41
MSGKPTHIHTVTLAQPIPAQGKDQYWHILTGGIAGGISRTLTSPLERLKILRQTSSPEYQGLSIWQSLVKFNSSEGVKGFFRGNGSNVMRIVPFSAIEFYTFEYCKERLLPADNPRHKGRLLLCGSLAGIAASSLTYPLDFVRTMLTVQTGTKYKGMWDAGKQVYQAKGFFALYKGLFTSLLVPVR